MKQKLFALSLAVLTAIGLTACGSTAQTAIADSDPLAASAGMSEDFSAQSAAASESASVQEGEAAVIESTVLVDQDGIVITAQELVEDEIWGTGIKFLVENNSSKSQTIGCDYAVVNNFMMTSLPFGVDVAAGKKSNEILYFSNDVMEGADIQTITDMSFVFRAVDPDTYQTVFTTQEVSLSTSAAGSYEQSVPSDGKELYNENGVRVVGRYVEEDTLWGAGIVLLIENTGESDIILSCDDMSINGFMVSPFFSARVNSGRMALSNITITSSDLEENGIESVEDVEMVFKALNPDNYQTIFETSAISFSVGE